MTKATSVFLDCLRVLAALIVFSTHCVMVFYSDAIRIPGHEAVIIFFVLSGYVIAYTTLKRKNGTARQYILARLSRLYSVVLPALVLTALTVAVGKALHLADYDHIVRDHDTLRFVMTALFLQSIWWHNLCPPADGPFWSLGYEFWYYAIFGGLVFVRNPRWKIIFVLVCCLIVGTNVLLLLPVWLLGAGLYIYGNRILLSRRMAAVGFTVAWSLSTVGMLYLPQYPGHVGSAPCFYSTAFLSDSLLGVGIAAVICFFDRAWGMVPVNPRLEKSIRWPANHSFSLYLFHLPLIYMFQAFHFFNPYIWWNAILEIGLILAIIALLSEFTESKRKYLERGLNQLWDVLAQYGKKSFPEKA